MDDKTLQAMTALAAKLGTTAEYLWGVLLRQAPITGAVDLLVMAAWVAAALCFLRYVRAKTTRPPGTRDDPFPRAQWDGDATFFAWAGAILFAVLTGLIVGASLSTTIAALVNPEYWALRQILK
jgi:ribose/xylose/arabinose/galactoside ABC-type transport system permease subunit